MKTKYILVTIIFLILTLGSIVLLKTQYDTFCVKCKDNNTCSIGLKCINECCKSEL